MAKRGRPTTEPKCYSSMVRLSAAGQQILVDCSTALKISRAEVIRKGIRLFQEQILKSRED